MSILLADGKEAASTLCAQALSEFEQELVTVKDGLKAFEQGKRGIFDLIVLAGGLPILESNAVSRALREAKITTPILLLLPTPSDPDIVEALDAGADSVLPLTADAAVVEATVRALVRRGKARQSPLMVSDLTLDVTTRRAERAGQLISLSSTEYNLLELLMRHVGQVVERDTIMQHVWPENEHETDNVLDVYVSYLRAKIDRGFTSSLIQTVRGHGYLIGPREG